MFKPIIPAPSTLELKIKGGSILTSMKGREHLLSPVRISLKKKTLESYESIVGRSVLDEIAKLAAGLKGLRVLHLNSTASGGGVAELLTSLVPLEVAAGIDAEWKILPQHPEFFKTTKLFHNALQGDDYKPSAEDIENYLDHNRLSAASNHSEYDVVITHDPQPAAFRHFAGPRQAKWVWRCHIDTSHPNEEAWGFLRPYVQEYDAAVFTMPQFAPPDLGMAPERVFFIAPAIDPLSTKNWALPGELSAAVLSEFGVDTNKPLLTQVSRFDPWKDPHGVIRIYKELKKRMPDLQLALIGFMATDDPQAWDIYASIEAETKGDPDAFIFTNIHGVGSLEVNAFQRLSNVIVQKSIKEGFGLVVSEGVWKETPVVAGDTGGIPLQISDGIGGFLAHNDEEFIRSIEMLLRNPVRAGQIAAKGKERVRRDFLVTRLLTDELKLLNSLVTGKDNTW